MRLQSTANLPGIKSSRRGEAKFSVLVSSDHAVHLVIDFDKERMDIPLTPNEAQQLGTLLFGGAQQVRGVGVGHSA